MGKKIRPCLWYNGDAEEAVNFYKSVIKDLEIIGEQRYPDPNPFPGGEELAGKALVLDVRIFDEEIIFLNAGSEFQLSEAFSLSVETEDQKETDYYWYALSADGGDGTAMWLAERQVWAFVADCAETPHRAHE